MESLREILRRALTGLEEGWLEEGWLYLPRNEFWHPETPAVLVDFGKSLGPEDLDENGEVRSMVERGLVAVLDCDTIESIVEVARRDLEDPPSDMLLFEAFYWYVQHDAFLPAIGAQPMTPAERDEAVLADDREFYLQLGPERPTHPCRERGCARGAVERSVRCRIHHFQQYRNKRCPFDD